MLTMAPKKKDPAEQIYYEDRKMKVTESYVTIYKRAIIPLERIQMVEVDHKVLGFYAAMIACILSFGIFFFENYSNYFIPVFVCACIWLRYEYEHYVELFIRAENGVSARITVFSMSRRDDIYRMADAIQRAIADYHAKKEKNMLTVTETMRLRRFLTHLDNAELEKSPENMKMLDAIDKKTIQE